ncbi:MAG: adenylate/guanylate cyclase domain-containing protein [Pseudomonadota bacterium]
MRWLTTASVGLAILFAALAFKVLDPPLVEAIRLRVFDAYQQYQPRAYGAAPVRIIDVDDESLRRLGQWPWPRNLFVEILDRLNAMGVAATGFGVVFAEPDRVSPQTMLRALRQIPGFSLPVQPRALFFDNDAALAGRIAGLPVVTSFALTHDDEPTRPAVKWGVAIVGSDPLAVLPVYDGAVVNIESIEAAASGNGSLNVLPDRDGVVRSVPMLADLDGEALPALAGELLRVVQGASTYVVRATDAGGPAGGEPGIAAIRIGSIDAVTRPDGGVLIHFAGSRPERYVPAWQVLDGSADPELLAGHLVLIGASAAGVGVRVPTPLDPVVPGIEVQAELLEQLIENVSLQRPEWAHGVEAVFLVAVGALLIVVLQWLGPISGAVVALAAVTLAIGTSILAFLEYRLLLDPILPSLTLVVIYMTSTLTNFVRTEAERGRVRRAFSLYLSPVLVRRLAANPTQLKLGGETRDLTIMFCDIRSFTSLSETMTAAELTRFLNRFLTPMTDTIQDHSGTIDKYMGDGIMAFWNAPLDVPDHCEKACAAVLAMRARLAELNGELAAERGDAHRPVRIGMGLNTGECSVGNLGSERRFSYSAIGEPVNLASRFEGQCKVYGCDVLISVRTRDGAPAFATLELDLVKVVGSQKPEPIFALLGDPAMAALLPFKRLEALQQAFLAAYRRRDWDTALARIDDCSKLDVGAPLVAYYAMMRERIGRLRTEALPDDWDAVVAAEQK